MNHIHGGFGSGVLEILSKNRICIPTLQIGAPDRFIPQGSPQEQLKIVLPKQGKNYMYPEITPAYSFLKTYMWECHAILPHL